MCVAGDAVWAKGRVPMAARGPICRPAEPAQLSVTCVLTAAGGKGWHREPWSRQAGPPATAKQGRGCCQTLFQPQWPWQQGTSAVPATPQGLSDISQGTRDKLCRG